MLTQTNNPARRCAAIPSLALVLVALAGCGRGGPPPLASAAPPAVANGAPSLLIAAPSEKVRQVIAARAEARGTVVAANDPRGVVLERSLVQTPPAIEAACGPHQPGRIVRVVLATAEEGRGTRVSERKFIVDGQNACPFAEADESRRSLADLAKQVTGTKAAAR